jgi:hypothetical protein
VEVAVAVVVAVTAVTIGNPQHAIDGADRSAHARADGATDSGTYRACHAAAFVRSFLRAADDPLRMSHVGNCQERKYEWRRRKQARKRKRGRQRRRRDPCPLPVHFRDFLYLIKAGRILTDAALCNAGLTPG